MNPILEMISDLRAFLGLSRELSSLAEQEAQALRQPQTASIFQVYEAKKNLLPHLNQSLDKLRKHRVAWQKLSAAEKAQYPETEALFRQLQDLIMKVIVLDRENEQGLLRRGLIPARELPSVHRQRPGFVSAVYQRQGAL